MLPQAAGVLWLRGAPGRLTLVETRMRTTTTHVHSNTLLRLGVSLCLAGLLVVSCDQPKSSRRPSSGAPPALSTVPSLDSDNRFKPLYEELLDCVPTSPLDSLVRLQCVDEFLAVERMCAAGSGAKGCIQTAVPRAHLGCVGGEVIDLVVRMAAPGGPKGTSGLLVRRLRSELVRDTIVSLRGECSWRMR